PEAPAAEAGRLRVSWSAVRSRTLRQGGEAADISTLPRKIHQDETRGTDGSLPIGPIFLTRFCRERERAAVPALVRPSTVPIPVRSSSSRRGSLPRGRTPSP